MKTFYIKAESVKDAIAKFRDVRDSKNDKSRKGMAARAKAEADDEEIEEALDDYNDRIDWGDEDDIDGNEVNGLVKDGDDVELEPMDGEAEDLMNEDEGEDSVEIGETEEDVEKPANSQLEEICNAIMENEQFRCESAVIVGPNKIECTGGVMVSDYGNGTKWYAVLDTDGSLVTYVDLGGKMVDFEKYEKGEVDELFLHNPDRKAEGGEPAKVE